MKHTTVMKTSKYILALVFTVWCAVGNLYAVTSDYYSSVNGKSGADLFNAVHSVAKTGYTTGLTYKGLWTVYCDIDLNSSSKVWDMYSNATSYTCGGSAQGANYSKEGDSYNREHSIPKSWFGGSEEAGTPGTDLFHVVPTDGFVNNQRSAYAFGEVSSASYTSQSGCKKGTPKSISISNSILNKSGSSSQSCTASTVFEPMDEFKGDFARGYLGTMIRWANGDYQKFTTAEGAQIFNTAYDAAHYYGLTGYGVALLLKWHREDPVSQKEIDRNDGIQSKQGNRNPFIDYPELVEYIWGEHSGEIVTLSSLTPTFSGYTPPAATTYTVILSRNGVTEAVSGLTGEYTLPAKNDEAAACTNWAFAGWSTTKVTNASSAPSYVTKVSAASTVYAVYSKTTGSNAPIRKTPAAANTVMWAETWTGATTATSGSNSATPSANYGKGTTVYNSGTVTYTQSENTVYVRNEELAGGSKPELMLSSGKTWTISNIPTGEATELTLTYKSNNTKSSVTCSTTGASITGSSKSYTITTGGASTITLVFGCSGNTRIDDVSLIVKTAGTGGGGSSTTYDSEPEDCKCQGKLGTPVVTATPSDGTITLTWDDVTNATNGYTVIISKGVGYTTECGETSIGDITHSGTKNTCVITGLVNGLTYTTSVIANATATICESVADEDSATPIGCTSWDVAFSYSTYTIATGDAALAPSIEGTTYGAVTFESSKPSVLEVAADGKVTPKGAGTATITASWAGNETYCPKVMTTSQFTVTGTLSVTYDKNDGTATPATTTQEVDYNEPVTLAANTFSRTGYTFQGWATTRDGSKVYDDKQSDVTFTETTTLYAVWQANKHKVTFDPSPTGATVTVNSASTSPVNNVDFGSTVNIVVTPAAHYSVGSVTANGGVTVTGSGSNWSFSMPDKDVAITVTMVEDTKYTVNWYVSGTPTAETNYAGEALAGISDPTIDCNDKVFVGWTATANYSSDDTAPTDLFTDPSTKTMPSNNTTNYYAVFAELTSTTVQATFDAADVTGLTESPSKTWTHDATGIKMQLVGSSSRYTNGTPNTWTMSHASGSKTVITASTNITQIVLRSVYQYTSGGQTRNGWVNDASPGTLSPTTFTGAETDGFVTQTISGINAKTVTIQDNSSSQGNQARVILVTVTCGSTTYTGYTTSCTAPTEVTVTFNANYGDTPATKTQDVSYNSATALDANTFTREGYSFAGWATTADGSKAYDNQESVTLTKNTTLYALWTKNNYSVTFSTPTGASAVTVNGQSISPQSVEFGTTVTVAVTPAITHTIGSVSAGSAVVTDNGDNTYTFTMPASDVTISVTMNAKPTYTIRFLNNGNEVSSQTVIQGQMADKPSDPTPCDEDYTFEGWWTAALAEDNEESHTWITDFTATQNQDYYAVFSYADGEGGGSSNVVFNFGYANDWGQSSSWSGSDKNSVTATKEGVTVTHTRGTGSMYANLTATRFYKDNTLTFAVSGNTITSIVFTCSQYQTDITSNVGTCTATSSEFSWSGDASSVSFSRPSNASSYSQFSAATITVGGGSTTYYTTAPVCAACENKITLTKGTPANGSFTLDKDNGEYDNCKSKGFVVTVSGITPDEDYEFDAITQTGIAEGVTIDQEAKTVTYAQNVKGASTINVTFRHKPQYTIKFYDNGSVISEQLVTINKSPVVPDDPEGCDEYEFVGWWTDELADDNTTAQTWVTSFTATEDKNYYAVFRHAETSGGGGASNDFSLYSGALTEGDYLIVYDNGAMNTTVSSDRLQYEVVTPTNDVITTTDATIIWHIAPSGDYWTIYNADAEKYAAGTGAKNKAQMLADGTDNKSLWTVSGTSTYEFVNKANTANSVNANLRKNDTYGYACYATATGGALSLYKNASSGSTTKYYTTDTDCRDCSIPTLSFAATTVNKFDGDAPFINALTISGNTMGATVSYTSSNPAKAEVSADGTVTINDAMSTEPVTITATLAKADDGVNCQKKVTAAYTLNIYNKVTWLVNGEEYTTGTPTIQTTEGGTIEIAPTEPDGSTICFGKAFVGWTTAEYEEDDAKPETLYTSSSIVGLHITQKTTFYAVFAELTGTLNEYRKGTPVQLTTGQKVIIVNTAANKAMKAVSSFKAGYDVTPVADAFVTEEQSIIWTVEQADGGGYYFMYGDNYLNASGSSLYLDGDEDAWTVTGASPYIITSGKYPSYSLEWYSGEFKSFTTGSGDAFNMDLYFPNWTIGAYATTCGLCMPKPEVTSTIIKSDRVTITWKAVVNATGYEFTCSGGEVSVSGTTATITGLTPLSDYTYSIRAQGGAPYTCFRTTNGSFSTPDCDDMPYDITATPYNVVQAIIRWKAEAERGKVVVYNDEACTSVFTTVADTVSPCYVSGLEENTRYWFKVFGGVSQDCASPVQTFLTQTTAVEIVEWQNDGVIILLTGDETTASVLIEGKNDNATDASTSYADSIFFSKYFEAASNTKLLAVFNGTNHNVNIADYKLAIAQGSTTFTQTRFDAMKYYTSNTSEASFTDEQMLLTPGSEMILITYPTGNAADAAIIKCAQDNPNSPFESYYRLKSPSLQFNGDDAIGLVNPQGELIDLIGAGTLSGSNVSHVDATSQSGSSGGSYHGFMDKPGGWYNTKGYHAMSDGTDTANYALSTNRCLLIRRNHVKSGLTAVARNTEDFITLGDYTYLGENYEGEWKGVQIPGAGCEDGNCEGVTSACGQFDHVGSYDYQEYYATFEPVDTIETLTPNDDGTITIPIPKLDTMSCTMLRINVYDKTTQEQKASREYRIPIMVQSGEVKSTNKLFTKHGVAVCKECDVLVYSGAKLIKDNDGEDRDTIGNLTLYPGSTLELPDGKGAYHVKSLTYRVEGDSVPVTKLSADDHLYTETQRLVVSRRIKNDRYYFISFPYDVNVNEITLANGSKAVNGKDFRLMEYDAEARAAEGSLQGAPGHWKLFTGDKLTAGQGYAIAVNTKAMKEIVFPMTLNSKNLTYEERTKQTNTVDINEYTGAARNTNHNWNLIAHPYITKFEVTSGAANVEAYWEEPHRYNTDWFDDWKTWSEEDPTQGTDSTETHTGEIVESGTTEGGIVWVLYADGSIELTGAGQMSDFTSLDAVPWAQHRQLIQNVKIGGDVQKIGKYAFGQCTNLTNVIIAAPVTNLASQAFAGCTGLRTFRIESAQYVSATTTTFDGISSLTMISLYVPQSMYSQYSAQTPWSKMAISAFDDNSTTGGQTSGDGTNTTNPSPRRAPVHDGWTESPGGIYVTIPVFRGGKVDYDQYWINEVADIKPFTAVFIQGDGQGEMTFNMYPSSPAPKRMLQAAPCETRDHTVFVGLTINGNGQKDKTSLRLRPDFTEEYKFNLDLLKFTVFNTARPQIYFKTPNEQLAFRAVSDSLAANTWLPVGVYCRDAGEYTFALHDRYVWDEVEAVYLRDNVTGAETNLLMGNYTITTTGQIYTNTRFAVKVLLRRKVKDTPTMIDHTEDPNAPRKFFRDGLLYIMRDGKVYDLTGKPVQFDDLLNR